YFEKVFNASGGQELVQKYGSWFSFTDNPRAQIFRRNQTLVTDIESMVRLMRYNNYKEDPLSWCDACDPIPNGENSISARSDLNPANGTQRQHGGTDMKVGSSVICFCFLSFGCISDIPVVLQMTSADMFKRFELLAVSGPTSSPYSKLLHMGHPDRWAFDTVH
ncbi:hypothetical protein M9458_021026, partial [Cirrhinus mrigala]